MCLSGAPFARGGQLTIVLILVIVDVPIRLQRKSDKQVILCLNPCYSGCAYQALNILGLQWRRRES